MLDEKMLRDDIRFILFADLTENSDSKPGKEKEWTEVCQARAERLADSIITVIRLTQYE